jgi:hypothetical protein
MSTRPQSEHLPATSAGQPHPEDYPTAWSYFWARRAWTRSRGGSLLVTVAWPESLRTVRRSRRPGLRSWSPSSKEAHPEADDRVPTRKRLGDRHTDRNPDGRQLTTTLRWSGCAEVTNGALLRSAFPAPWNPAAKTLNDELRRVIGEPR